MPEITLRQLQYYVRVIEHGSVTAAAAACHISQAAVSMAISQLERSLETDLLIRSRSKRVAPTPAGREFAAHARAVLARVAEAEEAMTDHRDLMRGPLNIGFAQSISPRLMPVLAEHFTTRYPEVELGFREGAPSEIQDAVRDGHLDFALVYELQAAPDLTPVRLIDIHLHVMLPATHPLAGEPGIHLAQVIGEPAVLLDVPPTIERLTSIVSDLGLRMDVRWRSSNMETIRCMVARGLGYSLINSVPATGATFDGRTVVYLPVLDAVQGNALVGVLPSEHRPSRRVEEALEALRSA
ncbi:LysR family transcriptional regulator [Arthrobacter ginkgonis]|uniref:LysR family transcriptional regulator n=1 Tax=Arthrobacter ginkgonis TaxID=1630594 RepID=A0ABP7CNJ8_9MICC